MRTFLFFSILLFALSCAEKNATKAEGGHAVAEVPVETSAEAAKRRPDFRSYWFSGVAELNRYEMKRGRYDGSHDGEAVLVFVTEPFLRGKQVKYESGDKSDAVDVLKLNAVERFYTGVYPYTIMTSIFSPVDQSPTLKIVNNVQEWCGAVWVQLNRQENGYRARSFSYFQSEGDQDVDLPDVHYEDTFWTTLRIDPNKLPTGEIKAIPSMTYLRLAHKPSHPFAAQATLLTDQKSPYWDKDVSIYKVKYPGLNREVTIHFEPQHPYLIVGFDETRPSIFGGESKSTAKLTKSIMLDYWSKHGVEDAPYRKALGLEY